MTKDGALNLMVPSGGGASGVTAAFEDEASKAVAAVENGTSKVVEALEVEALRVAAAPGGKTV